MTPSRPTPTPDRPELVVLTFASILLLPSAASAQRLPGMPGAQGGTVAMHQAEFYAHIMDRVRSTLDGWHEAWADDDADDLAARYAEDAVVAFPGARPVWGRSAVLDAVTSRLANAGEAQVAIGDVSASGRMAYVGGRFLFELQSEEGGGQQLEGFHFTVFYRTGGEWLIRSQVFHPAPAVDRTGSPGKPRP